MTDEPTRDDLLERARTLDVQGRSAMNKEELGDAVATAESQAPAPVTEGLDESPIEYAERSAAERIASTKER